MIRSISESCVVAVIATVLMLSGGAAVARSFTSKDGRTIDATVVKVTKDAVVLNRKGSSNVTVPLSLLIEKDVKFLEEWAEKEKTNRIPKVDIKVNSNKRDRRQDDRYEDREGQFQFELFIENREQNFNIEGATGLLIVYGKYFYNRGEGIVMQRTEFSKIDIANGGKTKLSGKLVKYKYDKDGYKHGQKYDGYIFILRSAVGKIIAKQGSTSRIEALALLISKLKMGERFEEKNFKSLGVSNRLSDSVLR